MQPPFNPPNTTGSPPNADLQRQMAMAQGRQAAYPAFEQSYLMGLQGGLRGPHGFSDPMQGGANLQNLDAVLGMRGFVDPGGGADFGAISGAPGRGYMQHGPVNLGMSMLPGGGDAGGAAAALQGGLQGGLHGSSPEDMAGVQGRLPQHLRRPHGPMGGGPMDLSEQGYLMNLLDFHQGFGRGMPFGPGAMGPGAYGGMPGFGMYPTLMAGGGMMRPLGGFGPPYGDVQAHMFRQHPSSQAPQLPAQLMAAGGAFAAGGASSPFVAPRDPQGAGPGPGKAPASATTSALDPPPPPARTLSTSAGPAAAASSKAAAGEGSKKAARRRPRDPGPPEGDGEEGKGKEAESAMSDDSQRVVLKRLKQNRESARKSRERKKLYKEQLLAKIPLLRQQQEEMGAALEGIVPSVQETVMQVLSPTLQALVTLQWQYYDECSQLETLLEGGSDEELSISLAKIDASWKLVLAQQEKAAAGADAFMLLSGKHMPPAHRMWLWMGGMRMTTLARTFLGIAEGTALTEATRVALTRLVERWTIQEDTLERGKMRWGEIFVDCCISVIQSRPDRIGTGLAAVRPEVLGKMDAIVLMLHDAIQLRRSIMQSLRSLLTNRQISMLLVTQVRLLESVTGLIAWSPSGPPPGQPIPLQQGQAAPAQTGNVAELAPPPPRPPGEQRPPSNVPGGPPA